MSGSHSAAHSLNVNTRRRVPCPGDPETFCQLCDVDTDCDPAGRCAGRACETGACVDVPPVDCDDGRQGNVDTCVVDSSGAPVCRHTCFNPTACDDGNRCNGAEGCTAGACRPGVPLDCDDGDGCTDDRCEPATGCARVERTGFPLTACSLDAIEAAIAAAPDDLTRAVRRAVLARTAAIRGRLVAAEEAGAAGRAARARRLLRRAEKNLGKLEALVRRKADRDRITGQLAETLLTRGTGRATAAVISLLEGLRR